MTRCNCYAIISITIKCFKPNIRRNGVKMDIKYTVELNGLLSEFMNSNGFSSEGQDTGYYRSEAKVYKVAYDEALKEFSIASAQIIADEEPTSFKTLSAWLFDEENHGAKDISCISEDFIAAVAKEEHIKLAAASVPGAENVALPEKGAVGEDPGIEAFTQKFLAMFPQYKDSYKNNVAKYGDFLYVEFFKTYGVEKMCELKTDEVKNKKALKKYWDMLGSMHYEGEQIVGDVICAVIIAGSYKGDTAAFTASAEQFLSDYPFLKTAGYAAVNNYKSDKKLRAVLEQ